MNYSKSKNIKIIKKYNSRRLYDTTSSKYISFTDLGKIITDGFDVYIFDSKTHQDITQQTLASYLTENIYVLDFFSNDLLRLIIKNQCHSNEFKSLSMEFIDQSLAYWKSLSLKE